MYNVRILCSLSVRYLSRKRVFQEKNNTQSNLKKKSDVLHSYTIYLFVPTNVHAVIIAKN